MSKQDILLCQLDHGYSLYDNKNIVLINLEFLKV